MSLKKKLLKILEEKTYIPLTLEELAEMLKIKDIESIRIALQKLLDTGEIILVQKNKYCTGTEADLVTGTIKFRQNGAAVVFPDNDSNQKSLPTIHIKSADTGLALSGDRVLIQINPPKVSHKKEIHARHKPKKESKASQETLVYARVVRVLDRSKNQLVGTLKKTQTYYYVIPDDPTITQDILVPPPEEFAGEVKPQLDDKVVVKLKEWIDRHLNPSGEIVEILGKTHTPGAEFEAILRKYNLKIQFPKAVEDESRKIPARVIAPEFKERLDCRDLWTFTIDPDDSKDFDDAISIEKLQNEEIRVGIHIADVSHYIKMGSALDKEASNRGNSTYLVGCVVPMLPYSLSNGICSLVENEDRFTKSVFVTFSKTFRIVKVEMANTVIRSNKRLTYKQAAAFIHKTPFAEIRKMPLPEAHNTGSTGRALNSLSNEELNKLQICLTEGWKIAKHLRTVRFDQGSLDLDMPEIKIYVDKKGFANKLVTEVYDESHQFIEEFMLLANELVAKKLFQGNYPFLSRVHDQPDAEKLEDLSDTLMAADIIVGDLTNKNNVQKLLKILKKHPYGYIYKVQFLRSLKQACYRADADGHYGLAKKFYAHFTSPIRRYSDLVVHRIFEHYLWDHKIPSAFQPDGKKYNKGELASIAQHVSTTERNSTDAERESIKVKLLEYFYRELEKEKKSSFKAIILDIKNHGFFIELVESLAFGYISLSSLEDDFYLLSEDQRKLRGKKKGRIYELGQVIDVEVFRVDRFKRQIDFKPVATQLDGKKKRKSGNKDRNALKYKLNAKQKESLNKNKPAIGSFKPHSKDNNTLKDKSTVKRKKSSDNNEPFVQSFSPDFKDNNTSKHKSAIKRKKDKRGKFF